MSAGLRHSVFTWLALLLLAAVECGSSFVHSGRGLRPLLLLPALVMVVLVAVIFMRIRQGVAAARGFALAGLLWLLLLLGLGSMDPMTRAFYVVPVPESAIPQ